MSKIAPASPPYPERIQKHMDAIMPAGVPPLLLFRVLARDERLFQRSMGAALLDRGHLSVREREIVILRVCANYGSEYEWGVHVAGFAAQARLGEEEQRATRAAGDDAACWSARERLLVRLCDELCVSTRVSDALWAELSVEFTEEALLELLLLQGFYRTISVLTNTLDLPLESFGARFDPT